MKKKQLGISLLIGVVMGLPLAGILYLGEQLKIISFWPFDIFDQFSRRVPGGLITAGIEMMVKIINFFGLGPTDTVAKSIEQTMALLLFIVLTGLSGLFTGLSINLFKKPGWATGAILGGFVFLVWWISAIFVWPLSIPAVIVGAVLIVGWFSLLGIVLTNRSFQIYPYAPDEKFHAGRRAAIRKLTAASVTITAGTYLAARYLISGEQLQMADVPLIKVKPSTQIDALLQKLPSLRERTGIMPAPGTRSEITPNHQFYRIDIDTVAPHINARNWHIEMTGLLARPGKLSYSKLLNYPELSLPITLCCISNPIGGDLISTAFFTGARLRDVLTDFGLSSSAQGLYITSIDGYYESVTREDMMGDNTILVYAMNKKTLTADQGFPVRIFIPNRYGMKQPKWITRIDVVSSVDSGYWVDRGWNREARPQTLSIIDTVAKDFTQNGLIPVGGIAWAGNRGIRNVELQVDNGSWLPAQLLLPPLSPLAWVVWRYDWPSQKGFHKFRVRATDGTGKIQTAVSSPPHPNGATGYHEIETTI